MNTRYRRTKLPVAAGLGAVVTAVGLSVCSGVSSGVAQAGLTAPVPLVVSKTRTPTVRFPPEPRTGLFREDGLFDGIDRFINDDPYYQK